MTFTEHSFISTQGNRIVYNDWGDKDANPIICVHGLTGNGHDFDYLAEDLIAHGHRLIAVDLPGRGRSDFHGDPLLYNYDQYDADLDALLAHVGLNAPDSVDWLGVSLGGLLGMRFASRENTPIKRLLLNDVGPVVPQAALDFIHMVISQDYIFDTVQDLEIWMRATRGKTWGPVTNEQWAHMARFNARTLEDGRITYAYDPHIAKIFETAPIGSPDLWQYWDKITCPMLVLQGADSLLLTGEIIIDMQKRGSDFKHVVFEGCGHVPSLMAKEQIAVLRKWLA